MSKEQQLEWHQIPEELREICHRWVDVFSPAHSLKLANQIMQAIKPIVEKAYEDGVKAGASNATRQYGDYWETSKGETYWNSLTTNKLSNK